MEECYENGGKLLIAGNGGSAADSEHIAGELMKRFKTPRPVKKEFADKLIAIDPERGTQLANNLECSLMAIPLVAHEALTTGLSDRKVIMQIEDDKSVSKAMYALLDISKIKKIGWNPIYSVRDALNKTFLIYKDRNQSN